MQSPEPLPKPTAHALFVHAVQLGQKPRKLRRHLALATRERRAERRRPLAFHGSHEQLGPADRSLPEASPTHAVTRAFRLRARVPIPCCALTFRIHSVQNVATSR